MKTEHNKYTFFILFFFIMLIDVNAQEEKSNEPPISQINMIARYTNNEVQMRFFPDKKAVLYLGIKHGFNIERAVIEPNIDAIENLNFKVIGTTKAYSEAQWKEVVSKSSAEVQHDLELAKDFYDAIDEKKGSSFNFDKGIKQMKEQKSAEDFEYLIFVMNAIKNKEVAKALGLDYVDKTTVKNEKYIYRVSLVKQPKLYKVVGTPFLLEANKEKKVERKIYVKPGDTKLSFMWEEKDMVSGALVERKNEITGKWEMLTKAPIYTLGNTIRNGFKDEGLTNYKTYKYRFYGYTPFGEKVMFGEAEGMPKDLMPPKKPIIKSGKHTKPNEVTIKWDVQKPLDDDLKGFIVARGEKNKGKFSILHKNLLSINTRSYIDKTFKKHATNYYVVQAIDTAGNVSSTMPVFVTLIDSIPPKKPKFLKGKIDSLGVVTLDIVKNKEKDLMGYRLFRANSDKHEFSVIREGFDDNDSIPKPIQIQFKDTVTLNSLTPYIYYRVKALDQNFNQSEFSDILKVKRPDKIAPTTPVFKNVIVRKEEVELHFALSKSMDVVEQTIYRKQKFDEPWKAISILKNDQKQYIDKNVEQGVKYLYSLRAKDDSDNYSKYAVAVFAKPFDNGVRPIVENLKIESNKKQISLRWSYPEKYKDAYFVIYKKDKKGNLIQYKNTQNKLFEEKVKNGVFSYAVKAFTKDGGESKVSDVLLVTIN